MQAGPGEAGGGAGAAASTVGSVGRRACSSPRLGLPGVLTCVGGQGGLRGNCSEIGTGEPRWPPGRLNGQNRGDGRELQVA